VFTTTSDKLNFLAMIYLGLLVKEVVIKLKANSPDQYFEAMARFSHEKKVLYVVFAVIYVLELVFFLRIIDFREMDRTLAYTIKYTEKGLVLAFDLFLVIHFVKMVHFLQRTRKKRVFREERVLYWTHGAVVALTYCLTGVQFLTVALELTYPGYDLFSDPDVNLYLCFCVMNILTLVLSLGFLLLFYKIGARQQPKH